MKTSKEDLVFDLFNTLILLVIGIVMLYPFYYILVYSLSDPISAQSGVYLVPKGFTFSNYFQVFALNKDIGNALFISTARTVIGTATSVMSCAMMAYGLSKTFLPGRKLMYRMLVVTMYISPGVIPFYIAMKQLHLKNNFLAYIVPYLISAFMVILLKTFFEQIPAAVEEAGLIDGAGYFTMFFKIILPLSMPVLATVIVFQAVFQWNSWYDNFLLVTNPKLATLQLMLLNFLQQAQTQTTVTAAQAKDSIRITPTSVRMTITMIATLPVFLIYPFMQRFFVEGIMIGAVKG